MGRDRRSSSTHHRHHEHGHHSRSPRRSSKALTADEKEFLRAQNRKEDEGRREESESRSRHRRRSRSRDRRTRRSHRSRSRDDDRTSRRRRGGSRERKARDEDEGRGDRDRHRDGRREPRRPSEEAPGKKKESAEKSPSRSSEEERSVRGSAKEGSASVKGGGSGEETPGEASPSAESNKVMDKREERRKRLMQLLKGAVIKDPLGQEKRVVLQPWQDDELEIDEEDAKKPAVFGLDAVGSVATSILRAEGVKSGGETKAEEEEDPLDKYMEELTAKTGVTVGGGAAAAAAAAGLSVMDAAMQNNTINLDEIEELAKAEQQKVKGGDADAEGEKPAVKEEGVVEDGDEDDDAYYEAFRMAMKESQKESENVTQIFAPVYEKEEELAPAKPEVFYDEEHDAADDNEDTSSSSSDDESDDDEHTEGEKLVEGESEKNKTAIVVKPEIKEDDISRMSYFELAKQFVSKKELPPVDHSKIDYYPIKKNLYKQVREISNMPEHEVAQLRQSNGDIRCPRPIKSFAMAGLDVRILRMLERKGITTPFPIQMQAIPALLCGRDVIAIAPTGSGKTLAYLLPMVRHVMAQPPLFYNEGPIGLVIAPTRELALQINDQAEALCHAVSLK